MRFFKPILSQKILYTVLAGLTSTLIFSSPLLALDPKKRITQYDMRLYQAEHGLPMNDMKTVFQDSKGYIWLGCQEGLVRFDGVRFVLFDKSKYPELRENFIWDIKEDWEGNLWLATNGGGVSRFDGKTFTTFDTSDGLASNVVLNIAIGRNKTIWFGTENGVTCRQNDAFKIYKLGDMSQAQKVLALHEDRRGNLLIGGGQDGLYIISNDSLFTLTAEENAIHSFHERANGEVILGAGGGRLYFYHNGRVDKLVPQRLPTDHVIRAIYEDREDNLWFATEGNGIVRYYAGRFENLRAESGLPEGHKFFNKILEDREKNLWFVGDGGLLKLSDNKFITFGRNEGFIDNFGNTVCEDQAGKMWVGFRQDGLVEFDRSTTTIWGIEHGLTSNGIAAVSPAQNGGLWIGTINGLNYLKDGLFRTYNTTNELTHSAIQSLWENPRGDIWIGLRSGYLTKFDGRKFSHYRLVEAEAGDSGNITSLVERTNGEVWAGMWKKGLYKLTNGNIYRFTEKDGIAADGVNALYEDNEQVLWIGTDGQALYRYQNGKFDQFTSSHGLYFDRLFAILEDDQRHLWCSGNRGIFRVSKQQLNDFAEGKTGTIISQVYNDRDGMRETECNGRRQPVAWKSRDGRLWFVSTAGVVCVDPNNMPMNKVPPPVYLEEVIVNKQQVIVPDSSLLHFEASERELEFRFTALSFAIPERVKFSYKLEGYDQNWVEAGTRRSAFYTNLPKGHYTFRVKACNNDGVWNEAGATVQLRIAPFWWETWWAYLLYALVLAGVFFGLRRYEMKRLHLRNALKLQQVRTGRLEELDHLKSRFFAGISHEFRTPLTLIGGPLADLLEKTRDEQKKSQMTMMLRNTQRLQRLVDQLLDLAQLESGKMHLQARPVRVIPFLQDLVAAFEAHALQKNIKLEFHPDNQLASESIFIDPDKMEKVIINLLSNALKYTPSGGRVEVVVAEGLEQRAEGKENAPPSALRPRLLAISVRDTGVGIPAQALPHIFDYFYRYRDENTRRESGTGIGLALTKELVELHHSEVSITSQEGVGSEFVIRLPLGKAHLKPEEIVSHNAEESDTLSFEMRKQATFAEVGNESISITESSSDEKPSEMPTVLLIEDNADMRQYLRKHLNHTNRLLEAINGEEGLQKAVEEIPDLIISDVMMPQMDGFELCRKLKTGEMTSHIPIILLTARGSGESKMQGLELGADDYLTKPVSGRELQLRVKNWMERQLKQRERFRREMATLDMQLPNLHITSADEKFLNRAREVLEKHLTNADFSPEAFAQEMAMSRAHLNRKLRGLLGQRTSEFIRAMRLKRAAELLRQKSGSVSEIAYQVGFNHLSYFARCFKEQYGQLPHEYGQ
jgi:signal transduction histidine kinase/ligand-binding sensor domain-containing protein/DNA-binding response OmpR family regulator